MSTKNKRKKFVKQYIFQTNHFSVKLRKRRRDERRKENGTTLENGFKLSLRNELFLYQNFTPQITPKGYIAGKYSTYN